MSYVLQQKRHMYINYGQSFIKRLPTQGCPLLQRSNLADFFYVLALFSTSGVKHPKRFHDLIQPIRAHGGGVELLVAT